MKKLAYIDALRGLAILGVMMVHTSQFGSNNLPKIVVSFITKGSMGVQLFYLASAFTLFLSFKNRFGKESFPIRNFFLRRFFRIAPMYYLGICYYLFQDGLGPRYWLGTEPRVTTLNVISNCTFLHGLNPSWINSIVPGGWSIAVEMTFYAVLPFLFSRIKNLNQAFGFFILSLLLRVALKIFFMRFHMINDDDLWNQYLFMYFPNQLPVFSLGVLLYFVVIENESVRQIAGKLILFFSVLLLLQFAIGIQFVFPDHILFAMAFFVLGYSLSIFRFMALVNPIVVWIGKISFSAYLVHFAVLHWMTQFHFVDYVNNGLVNYSIRFLVVSSLTIIIASIFYKIIELPFQELGKRLIQRLEANNVIKPVL